MIFISDKLENQDSNNNLFTKKNYFNCLRNLWIKTPPNLEIVTPWYRVWNTEDNEDVVVQSLEYWK